jgi:hypothetical protein
MAIAAFLRMRSIRTPSTGWAPLPPPTQSFAAESARVCDFCLAIAGSKSQARAE